MNNQKISNKNGTVIEHFTAYGKIFVYQKYQSHLKLKHPNENCKHVRGQSDKCNQEMVISRVTFN